MVAVNSMGGFDSDGCSYSSGIQPRTLAVATSPTTLYSARVEEWGQGVTEANQRDLLRLLVTLGAEVDSVSQLAPHERYELAAAVAKASGRDHFSVGDLYLHGAWTVRDTVVGFLPAVQGAGDAWEKLADLLTRSRELTEARGKTIALFDMARLAHRGGFLHERDGLLSQLDQIEDAGLGAPAKRTEFRRRVAVEDQLLRKARAIYLEGVAEGDRGPEDRAYYRFVAADLARRVGDLEVADRELSALALDKGLPKEVNGLIADVRAVLKVQARQPASSAPESGGAER